MPKPKISVIVPVYNVQDYLAETLESLLSQSMIDSIEVIMVDDGSTDDSRYIIERFALDYDNFHSYHKENEGQGIARNFGLKMAKGDYIHFLDSDDYIPPDAYETLYNLAVKTGSDIVVGNVLRFARYNAWEEKFISKAFDEMESDIPSTTLDEYPRLVWNTGIWNNLYKKEFLERENLSYINRKIFFEDLLFATETYLKAGSITITKDIVYYWRLRNNNTSVTQQDSDITNFKDRLEILRLIHELFDKHENMNPEIAEQEYLKWINHDLKFYLKRFDKFPKEYHQELFNEVYELVKLIPDRLIDDLSSYKKVLYRMILNRDFDNFILFAPLENSLYVSPEIPEFLDDEYKGYFDFTKSFKDEELNVEVDGVSYDESNIFIDLKASINYLKDEEHEISARIVDLNKGNSSKLEVSDNSRIIIPVSFVNGKDLFKIKVSYKFDDFEKESFLKIRYRRSFEFKDEFIDLYIGINSHLLINSKRKSDNLIEITDIEYDNNDFMFKAKSKNEISHIHVNNIITLKRDEYPVEYAANSQNFTFKIPFRGILDFSVKKWEINCDESANSIKLTKPFEFFNRFSKIKFINYRNKILIEHDAYNIVDEVYESHFKIESLTGDNARLKDELKGLKSRKVVRIADKLKFN